MIGAAVLAAGLLLIAAGVAAPRIPGGATFARPGIGRSQGRDPVRAFLLSPIHPATWYANASIGLGLFVGLFAFAVIGAAASAGLTTLLAGIGVILIATAIELSRIVARIERRRAFIDRFLPAVNVERFVVPAGAVAIGVLLVANAIRREPMKS